MSTCDETLQKNRCATKSTRRSFSIEVQSDFIPINAETLMNSTLRGISIHFTVSSFLEIHPYPLVLSGGKILSRLVSSPRPSSILIRLRFVGADGSLQRVLLDFEVHPVFALPHVSSIFLSNFKSSFHP
jgi:hypothetical protein